MIDLKDAEKRRNASFQPIGTEQRENVPATSKDISQRMALFLNAEKKKWISALFADGLQRFPETDKFSL